MRTFDDYEEAGYAFKTVAGEGQNTVFKVYKRDDADKSILAMKKLKNFDV
jgi:hypothetical protein